MSLFKMTSIPRQRRSSFPFRFTRISGLEERVLLTNKVGESIFVSGEDFHQFISGAFRLLFMKT